MKTQNGNYSKYAALISFHKPNLIFLYDYGTVSIPKASFIDVKNGPEEFVEELVQCEKIISSSMHGLILSDAYGIPNQWVRFSDRIIGGEYKYFDYYSTTDNDRPSCVSLISESQTRKLNIKYDSIRVNNNKFGLDDLLNSFPTYL